MTDTTSAGGAGSGTGAQIAQTAQQKASQGAGVVTQQASEVTDTVKQQAAAVTQETGTQARQLAAGLREQLSSESKAQGERLVGNLRSLADELREMGEHGQGDSMATTVVRRLAQGGHQVADHLEQRGPGGLLEEVQDFARRRPGLFLAGAALAGFAVARTGKDVATASSSEGDRTGTPSTAQYQAVPDQVMADQAVPPVAPLSEAGALGESTTTYAGGYAQPVPEPAPFTSPVTGTSSTPPPSQAAPAQWPQPDASR